MAKKIYPGAEFEPCDNEILPFVFDLFAQISLLAPLPARAKENLEKCPGAMRLRRFKQNDLICRQGEEDCTAFYLLKTEDLQTLWDYPQKWAQQAGAEKTAAERKLQEQEAAAAKALAEAKPKDAEKAQKQIKDLQEKLALLQREIEQMPDLQERVKKLALPSQQLVALGITNAAAEARSVAYDSGRAVAQVLAVLQAGDQANKQLEQFEQQAVAAGDKQKAGYYRELRSADAGQKRSRAVPLEREDAELAKLLRASAQAADLRLAAVVYLADAPPPVEANSGGWFGRLKRMLTGVPAKGPDQAPLNIPFDGPTEVSSRTRQASLFEGELFGEMACLNRAPRSATVVAARDCYILEMLSNILMEVDKDPGYQKERSRIYEERVLDLQLRALSVFADLTDEQFARAAVEIRGQLKLKSFKSGELICDEHERSDCVYLVRGGLVQVKKNVSSLLSVADVTSWPDLLSDLCGDGPAAALRKLLPPLTRSLPESAQNPGQLSADDRAEFVHGLNEAIKNPQLPAVPELKDLISRSSLHERVRSSAAYQARRQIDAKELDEVIKSASLRETKSQEPGKTEKWSELNLRRLNRLLLEEIVPRGLRRLPSVTGPDATLTYLSRGEFIGEMGVCKRQPRSSTCIAFGQPRSPKDEDLGEVELVQIPGEVFLRLMGLFPAIKSRVEAEMSRREKRDEQRALQPRPGDLTRSSKEAERLGLIQGQQLMLIDMERCTLCLECVRGCVDSHADGRSRLFLVGHRYEKYMVPITCRSCLDPVCMIGCPVRSIQRGDNREMVIKDWCIGCRMCAKNCPYDAIKMHDLPTPALAGDAGAAGTFRIRDEIAVVCDLCSSLPDQTPRCVYACPHEAAMRVNARVELPVF
jgi:Fe-S-cluster-containing hydrogenase component 2/CRP-like cAMP-binding protein